MGPSSIGRGSWLIMHTMRDEWPEIRSRILKRDNGACVKCGCPDNPDVHHLIPKASGGTDEPDNLSTRCPACHAQHHLFFQATINRRGRFIERWAVRIARWVDFDKQLPEGDIDFRPVLAIFGIEEFREGQLQVILAVLRGESLLYISPTGSGKSLCFQLPTLLRLGCCMVITPLKALMIDQVLGLSKRLIPATYINSDISKKEQAERIRLLEKNMFKFLYVAPERFGDKSNKADAARLMQTEPALFVVDEAHVISKWARSFRPDYRELGRLREKCGSPPVLCFTATAGWKTQDIIIENMGLSRKTMKVFVRDVDRPNIYLMKRNMSCDTQKVYYVRKLMAELPKGKLMVFVPTVKIGETVAEAFAAVGMDIPFYHGQLNSMLKDNLQSRYTGSVEPRLDNIICTNAFGMGLDIPNIRLVVHWQYPASIEDYVQEYGRAGRDDKESIAVLFFDLSEPSNEYSLQKFMIDKTLEKANPVSDNILTGDDLGCSVPVQGMLSLGTEVPQDSVDSRNLALDADERHEERRRNMERLEEMRDYALSRECLRHQISSYFTPHGRNTGTPVSVRLLEFVFESKGERSFLLRLRDLLFGSRKKRTKQARCCSICSQQAERKPRKGQ